MTVLVVELVVEKYLQLFVTQNLQSFFPQNP